MIFNLDTEKCEDIKLRFDRNADLLETIDEFCFGMSALYVDFCMQLGLNQEQVRGLLDVCQSCMTRTVEEMLSQGLLDSADEEDNEIEGVSNEELNKLEQAMRVAGFSEEEIQNAIAFVEKAGSMDAALGVLKGIGEDAGIDWTELENQQEDIVT